MTVDSTNTRTQTDGDGLRTNFPYGFKIKTSTDLGVYYTVEATQVQTKLLENTDYTVNDVGEEEGTIDLLGGWLITPPASGTNILCIRQPSLLQEEVFKRQGRYHAKDTEGAIDTLAMVCQYLNERIDRCLQVQEASELDPEDLTLETFAGSAPVDTSAFTNVLSGTEDTVQKCLDKIDEFQDVDTNTQAEQSGDEKVATCEYADRAGRILLASADVTNGPEIKVYSADVLNHKRLLLEFEEIDYFVTNQNLLLQFTDTSGNPYGTSWFKGGAYGYQSDDTEKEWVISGNYAALSEGGITSSGGTQPMWGHLYLSNLSASLYSAFIGQLFFVHQGDWVSTPVNLGAEDLETVRILGGCRLTMSSGNITGIARLWGLPKGS